MSEDQQVLDIQIHFLDLQALDFTLIFTVGSKLELICNTHLLRSPCFHGE